MANRNVIRVIHIRIMYCTRRKYKINMAHCANFARFIFISSWVLFFFCILLDRKPTTSTTLCAHYALCSHRVRSAICTKSFSALFHALARSPCVCLSLSQLFSSIVSFCDSPFKIENLLDLRPEHFWVHKSKLRIRSLRLAKQQTHAQQQWKQRLTQAKKIFFKAIER